MIPAQIFQQLLIIGVTQPSHSRLIAQELMSAQKNYQTIWLQTGHEVLEANQRQWSFILVDDTFTDIPPQELIRLFSPKTGPVPVVYLVEPDNEAFGIEVMRAGARDYILKSNFNRLAPVIQRDSRSIIPLSDSQQKTAKEEKGEEFIKLLTELGGEYVFRAVLTAQNQFRDVWFNTALIDHCHFQPEELQHLSQLYDVFHPYDHPKLVDMVAGIRRGKTAKSDCRIKDKNGDFHWYSVALKPLYPASNNEAYTVVLGTLTDITPRKLSEFKRENLLSDMQSARQLAVDQSKNLQQQAEEWEILFNTISDAILVYNGEGEIIKANQMAIDGLGLDPIGLNNAQLSQRIVIMNEDRVLLPTENWVFSRLARGEKIRQLITSVQNARGEFIWQLVSGDIIQAEGKLVNVVITWKDITSIILTNRELEEKEQTLRNVLQQSLDGVVLTDENGLITSWNFGQEKITGVSSSESIGRPLWEVQVELSAEADLDENLVRETLRKDFELLLITGNSPWLDQSHEKSIRRRDGEILFIESNIYVIPTRRGYMLGATSRDITDRKQAEKRIIEARDYYLKLLENFPAAVWLTDPNGQCNYVNQTWIDTTIQPGELAQINLSDYWAWAIHPEDVQRCQAEFSLQFSQRSPFMLQYRMRRKDGSYRWVADVGQAFTDLDGCFAGYIGACFEIHETIERQRELEIMLSISALISSAHDIHEMIDRLLDETARLVRVENSAFALPLSTANQLSIVAAKGWWQREIGKTLNPQSVPAQVFYQQKPLVNYEELSQAFKSKPAYPGEQFTIILPLVVQDRTIGLFSVSRNQAFTHSESSLINGIANIAATAINRANLHKEAELYAQKMAAIGSIGRLMAETYDLNGIYHLLNYAVHDLIENINSVAILRFDAGNNLLRYQYYVSDRQVIDVRTLAPIEVKRSSKSPANRVINERIPLIINCSDEDIPIYAGSNQVDSRSKHSALYVPLMAEGKVLGILEAESMTNSRFSKSDMDLMSLIANTAAISIENADLFSNLQKANDDLVQAYDTTLEGWALALELRDQETRGHSSTTLDLTVQFCQAAGISNDEMPYIRRGALLHDIGKMGIPDNILLKEGPLTDEEWQIMRRHPVYAFDLLNKIAFLDRSLDIPYCHHEHWDGSGYPRGLKGEEIPLAARIFTIVDVWNALQRDRPYRPAWSREKTVAYIQSQSGKQFDPHLVETFMGMLDSIE